MVTFGPVDALEAIRNFPRLEVVFEPADGPPIVERGRFGFEGWASFFFMASKGSALYARLSERPVPVRIRPIDSDGHGVGEALDCEASRWRGGMLYDGVLRDLQRKYWLFLWHTMFSNYIVISLRGHAEWKASQRNVDLNALLMGESNPGVEGTRDGARPVGQCEPRTTVRTRAATCPLSST